MILNVIGLDRNVTFSIEIIRYVYMLREREREREKERERARIYLAVPIFVRKYIIL